MVGGCWLQSPPIAVLDRVARGAQCHHYLGTIWFGSATRLYVELDPACQARLARSRRGATKRRRAWPSALGVRWMVIVVLPRVEMGCVRSSAIADEAPCSVPMEAVALPITKATWQPVSPLRIALWRGPRVQATPTVSRGYVTLESAKRPAHLVPGTVLRVGTVRVSLGPSPHVRWADWWWVLSELIANPMLTVLAHACRTVLRATARVSVSLFLTVPTATVACMLSVAGARRRSETSAAATFRVRIPCVVT